MNPLASEAQLPGETKSGSDGLDFETEADKAANDGGPARPPRRPWLARARPVITVGFAVGPGSHSEHHGGPPDPGAQAR